MQQAFYPIYIEKNIRYNNNRIKVNIRFNGGF